MNEVKAESRNEENTAHWYADRLMITDKGMCFVTEKKGSCFKGEEKSNKNKTL